MSHVDLGSSWSANLRPPRLEGTWALSGHDPAHGPLHGQVSVRAVPGTTTEFTTEASWIHPEDGTRATRTGRAIVYTGYQWRGRSNAPGGTGSLARARLHPHGDFSSWVICRFAPLQQPADLGIDRDRGVIAIPQLNGVVGNRITFLTIEDLPDQD